MAEEAIDTSLRASAAPPGTTEEVLHPSVFHHHHPGYVVDEEEARAAEHPCLVYETEAKERELVFKRGIVGPLDERQRALYCTVEERREVTPAQEAARERLAAAAELCKEQVADLPHGEKMGPFEACLMGELKAKAAAAAPAT